MALPHSTHAALAAFVLGLAAVAAATSGGGSGGGTVAPLPANVMRGLNVFPFAASTLADPEMLTQLDDMKAMGVHWVPVMIQVVQDNVTANTVGTNEETASDDSLRTFLRAIKERGMEAEVKPIIVPGNNASVFILPEDPEEWFYSYGTLMKHYATIAQDEGAGALSVGVELTFLMYRHGAMFEPLIQELKTIFTGKYTYCALFAFGYTIVPFWKEMDWIGIDAYFPLANATVPAPPVADLRAAWDGHMAKLRAWWKGTGLSDTHPIVFTEVGFGSYNSVAVTPSSSPHSHPGCVGHYAPDFAAQQRAYEATLGAIGANADMVQGVFWFWIDNPSSPDWYVNATTYARRWPCYFTPRGKPAMQTLASAFALPESPSS